MNNSLLIATSIIIGALLGIVSNVVANMVQPHLEKRRKLLFSLFVGLVGSAVLFGILSPSTNAYPPPTFSIISGEVSYCENEKWVLKRLSDDTEKQLAVPEGAGFPIGWSPSGEDFLFSWRESPDSSIGLYSFNILTESVSPFLILPDLNLTDPVWSPDGRLIAFLGWDDDQGTRLYTFDPRINETKRLTTKEENARQPTWSPDSGKIAYEGLFSPDEPSRIIIMDKTGENKRIVEGLETIFAKQPSWSPDGKSIAFVTVGENNEEIWTINLVTKKLQQVSSTSTDRNSVNPVWSPDSRWIAFHSNRESVVNSGYGDVYITNLDGSSLMRITSTQTTWFLCLSWRPTL